MNKLPELITQQKKETAKPHSKKKDLRRKNCQSKRDSETSSLEKKDLRRKNCQSKRDSETKNGETKTANEGTAEFI